LPAPAPSVIASAFVMVTAAIAKSVTVVAAVIAAAGVADKRTLSCSIVLWPAERGGGIVSPGAAERVETETQMTNRKRAALAAVVVGIVLATSGGVEGEEIEEHWRCQRVKDQAPEQIPRLTVTCRGRKNCTGTVRVGKLPTKRTRFEFDTDSLELRRRWDWCCKKDKGCECAFVIRPLSPDQKLMAGYSYDFGGGKKKG